MRKGNGGTVPFAFYLFLIGFGGVGADAERMSSYHHVLSRAEGEVIDYLEIGTIDSALSMNSRWQVGSYGTKSLDDRSVAVNASSGWGFCCDYGNVWERTDSSYQSRRN